jgi:predicted ATPase
MEGKRLLHSIRLEHLLSYGAEADVLELEPLNVLIGPNASGKSNLIAAISLLAAAPKDLARPVREGGGAREWLWKDRQVSDRASLAVTMERSGGERLAYALDFAESDFRLFVTRETLFDPTRGPEAEDGTFFYRDGFSLSIRKASEGWAKILASAGIPEPRWGDVGPEESVLARIRDPHAYPQLTYVSDSFQKIQFFRDWNIGIRSVVRQPQRADLPDEFLAEDASNLGLVINKLKNRPATKRLLLEKLKLFSDDIEDLETLVQGGTIQLFLQERGDKTIPATRFSDGTLRYLCLLAILCHPEPPPLICLEEPELGLHPDILPAVADLLVDAAQRTQLIVTTHSETLVSALSGTPEAVVVCEKSSAGTRLRRLDSSSLERWLDEYRLGEVWRMGEIGGNRW